MLSSLTTPCHMAHLIQSILFLPIFVMFSQCILFHNGLKLNVMMCLFVPPQCAFTLDEPHEDENQHGPFEFFNDNNISFSRLLFDLMVWQVQGFDNGNANLNMLILDDYVQMSNAPFMLYMPMQSMGSMEVFPLNSSNIPLI